MTVANRVNVNINANDTSRAALAQLRANMRRLQRDARAAGGDIRFNVVIPEGTTRAQLRRIQRQLRGSNVTINTRLNDPTPGPATWRRRLLRSLGRLTIPLRIDGNRFRTMLLNTLRGPMRIIGRTLGGILQDGLGQGIRGAFQAAGPVGVAVLITAIVGAAAVLGAALSGLLITAFGLAFVGIGGVSAAMSKQVKDQWSSTLESLKEDFRDVGTPLIPVLDRAIQRLEKMSGVIAPALKKALADTAPATELFINKLLDSFESFGKAAFKPIMDAWNVFAPVFGEEWDRFMGDLGAAFADMADLVREHPKEIADALGAVLAVITFIVKAVTFLGETWVRMEQFALTAGTNIIKAFAQVGINVVESLGRILNGATWAFGWIPGLGDKLKKAQGDFQVWRDRAVGDLNQVKVNADIMSGSLDRANRRRTLEADIRTWQAKLSTARADLKKTTNQKAEAKVRANIAQLQSQIRSARAALNALNGKTVTTHIRTTYSPPGHSGPGGIPMNAHGGIRGMSTAATGGVRSNMTLVGEQGPEIVNLPPGSHVRSNPDSRRFLASQGGSGGGGVGVLEIVSDDAAMLELFRRVVRKAGGDFDVVFKKGRAAR